MANEEHLKILKQGVGVWNRWRKQNAKLIPDLSSADLREAKLNTATLNGANLDGANLRTADLTFAHLRRANLRGANLSGATLWTASFDWADLGDSSLKNTNLGKAVLLGANLSGANLTRADLSNANLKKANLNGTKLVSANFEGVRIGGTSFSNVDLSVAKGLDKSRHYAPSSICVDTLYLSGGKIPIEFLRGCGVPDDFITFIPSHFGMQEAIQFYSCFISYSTKDEDFARRLYSRMRDEKLRVWFAPEELKGGELLTEQIEEAIQVHDRLLVVLSEESMASDWVKREIRNARRAEKRENRRKAVPDQAG